MPRGQGKGRKAAKQCQETPPSFPFGIDLESMAGAQLPFDLRSLDSTGRSMFGDTNWHLKTKTYIETINDFYRSRAKTEAYWSERIRAIEMLSETDAGLHPNAELKRICAVKGLLALERSRMEEKDVSNFEKLFGQRPEKADAKDQAFYDCMKRTPYYPGAAQQISVLDAKLSATEAKLSAAVGKDSKSDRQKPSTVPNGKVDDVGKVTEMQRKLDDAYASMRQLDQEIKELTAKVKKEAQQKLASQEALKAADDKAERLEQKLRAAREETGELQFQLERAQSNAGKELKAAEDVYRSELQKNTAQIRQLKKSLTEAEKMAQRLRESDEVAALKRQQQKEREAWAREKNLIQDGHRKEIEKAKVQLRELQQSVIQAEEYARDMERHRREMRDARSELERLRDALAGAWDEKDELKRHNDRFKADAEIGANEILRLQRELESTSAKVEKLSVQITALQGAGVASAAQNRSRSDETFRTFQGQVYVTVFGNHDGYASIEQLLTDLREDHGINGDEIARNYGYDSLHHFLCSQEMASKIIAETGPNGVVYKGIPNETNAHLREAHQISSESQAAKNAKLSRNLKAEVRKVTNLRQQIKALHEQRRCQICMDRASDTTFLCGQTNGPKDACGHVVCGDCAENWRRQGKGCHLCRGEPIFKCVKLFQPGEQ